METGSNFVRRAYLPCYGRLCCIIICISNGKHVKHIYPRHTYNTKRISETTTQKNKVFIVEHSSGIKLKTCGRPFAHK